MPGEPFIFTYCDQQFEARAECLPSVNDFKRYKISFPNVQSIVEGSVYLTETPGGEWVIEKIFGAHPIHEEFLNDISHGFVEFIDNQKP
jgi:hypothetical protein